MPLASGGPRQGGRRRERRVRSSFASGGPCQGGRLRIFIIHTTGLAGAAAPSRAERACPPSPLQIHMFVLLNMTHFLAEHHGGEESKADLENFFFNDTKISVFGRLCLAPFYDFDPYPCSDEEYAKFLSETHHNRFILLDILFYSLLTALVISLFLRFVLSCIKLAFPTRRLALL